MCLTIPKKVIEIKGDLVIVEAPNGTRQEMKSIVDLDIGDFCLTQQNIAFDKISDEEAQEIIETVSNHKEAMI